MIDHKMTTVQFTTKNAEEVLNEHLQAVSRDGWELVSTDWYSVNARMFLFWKRAQSA